MNESNGTPSRGRLLAEVALAALLGLFPLAMHVVSNQASMSVHIPVWDFVCRSTYVLAYVTSPGMLVGMIAGGLMDIAGVTTNWQWLDRVEVTLGLIANMVLFGAIWFTLRCRPKTSLWRRAVVMTIAVWLVFTIPLAIFGSMWMVLS